MVYHLSENAANRPNIDLSAIINRTHQNIRRPIPESNNFMCKILNRNAITPGKSEIRYLEQFLIRSDQKVLRFQVSVEHFLLMTLRDSVQELVEETFNLCCSQTDCFSSLFHQFGQIVF